MSLGQESRQMSKQREVGVELQHEIEQLLYHEARLLDELRLHEWLDLFTDDARYCMPTREVVQGEGWVAPTDGAFQVIDDDKQTLELRVKRLDTGMAHVEIPASLTQRLITNVQVERTDKDDELLVQSSFVTYAVRHEKHQHIFVGKRTDRLRRVDGSWKIARREVLLVQPILPRSITVFF